MRAINPLKKDTIDLFSLTFDRRLFNAINTLAYNYLWTHRHSIRAGLGLLQPYKRSDYFWTDFQTCPIRSDYFWTDLETCLIRSDNFRTDFQTCQIRSDNFRTDFQTCPIRSDHFRTDFQTCPIRSDHFWTDFQTCQIRSFYRIKSLQTSYKLEKYCNWFFYRWRDTKRYNQSLWRSLKSKN